MGFSQSKEIWLLSQNHRLTVLRTQVSCTCICHFESCITGMYVPHLVVIMVVAVVVDDDDDNNCP